MNAPRDDDVLFWRLTTLMCGAGFATLALFVAVPSLDIWAAGLFFDGSGFPLGSNPAMVALRGFYKAALIAFCAAAVLMTLLRLAAPEPTAPTTLRLAAPSGWRTPLRMWLFLVALMAVGPGLIANALFKEHWGRARPEAVTAFGGHHPLTPPFALADACASNCSFVSGEGAAAAALAFGVLAVFWPVLARNGARATALVATALWLAGAALIRIGPGKHFLSDTLFAFILMGLTAAALYRLCGLRGCRAAATPEALLHDAGLAAALAMRAVAAGWRALDAAAAALRSFARASLTRIRRLERRGSPPIDRSGQRETRNS